MGSRRITPPDEAPSPVRRTAGEEAPVHRYRSGWPVVAGALGALGVALAVLALPPQALAWVALSGGVVCGVVRGHARPDDRADIRPGSSRPLAVAASAARGAFACLAIAGLLAVLGLTAALLVVLVVLGSPWALQRGATVVKSLGSPAGRPAPHAPLILTDRVSWLAWSPGQDRPDARSLTDQQLCAAWRASFTQMTGHHSASELAHLAQTRGLYLDEIERRHPVGFARWIAAGACAGSDPVRYLPGPPPGP